MRLKRVRVFGFKTFADRIEFSLEGGVVAVVGSNGCGKSNLVDAILWGLGEGSARQLRAATSQDVIFSGSSARKPVGFAEVTLLFDNEDGSLPIETPEVAVTRRLTRSGESEYRINRRVCRLRDVYELLADSGLGRAGYAIVGQKEIDSALSASAEDRRDWIDEAAGVQRYRARKIDALRRLATARENLERVGALIHELELQREPLREEAEVAAKYKNLVAALQSVELGLLLNEVVASVRDLRALQTQIDDCLRLAREESARAEELDGRAAEADQAVAAAETESEAVRTVLQACIAAKERAESDLRLATQRLEGLAEAEKSLASDAEVLLKRLAEAEAEAVEAEAEAKSEAAALAALKVELAGVGEEAKVRAEALRLAEVDLAAAREAENRRLKDAAEAAHRKSRANLARRELSGIEEALPDLHAAILEATQAHDQALAEAEEVQVAIRAHEAEMGRLSKEEDEDAAAVRKSLAERASLEGRKRGIEATLDAHEGLAQGTRAVLEAAERGTLSAAYVPVAQAVEADKELALAIETALGASANDLIVADPEDAKVAIDWLKAHRAGRATFQPIPLMRPAAPSSEMQRLLGSTGVIGRASDLVRCRAAHRPVIDSLLGRILVVETLDDALRMARTSGWNRLVTLEGEVVHSSGAVTGGQQSRQGYGLVQRKADLVAIDAEIARLTEVVDRHAGRTRKRETEKERLQVLVAAGKAQALRHVQAVQEARNYQQSLQDELRSAERSRTKLQEEIAHLAGPSAPAAPVDLAGAVARRDEAMKALTEKSVDAEQAESRLREAEARVVQAEQRRAAADRRATAAKEAEDQRNRRIENLEPDRRKLRAEIARHTEERERQATFMSDSEARLAESIARRQAASEESRRLAEESKQARENAHATGDAARQAEVSRARAEARRANAAIRLMEDYGIDEEDALSQEGAHPVPSDAATVVGRLRREIRAMGDVNVGAIEAFDRLSKRLDELVFQRDDVVQGLAELESAVRELDQKTRERFVSTFEAVREAFADRFAKLFGGGEGRLILTDPQNVLESGVEMEVTLPGKRRQALNLLSGGERALCACAFLFALLAVKPSPLVVLDEIDAPLDGRNVERFVETLKEFVDRTQFIVITHNITTMVAADVLLGVTMRDGASILVPARLPEDPEAAGAGR